MHNYKAKDATPKLDTPTKSETPQQQRYNSESTKITNQRHKNKNKNIRAKPTTAKKNANQAQQENKIINNIHKQQNQKKKKYKKINK